jgi:hypothetical protein
MARLVQLAVLSAIALAREVVNVVRFGRDAPRFAERIWVDPAALATTLGPLDYDLGRIRSGRVMGGDWDLAAWAIDESVVQACVVHWRDGVPWKDSGAYDRIMAAMARSPDSVFDGCRTLEDIERRHVAIDALFEQVAAEGRLRPRNELPGHVFREMGGVCVHVGRTGNLIRGGNGAHRLGMALALGLPVIPAMIGCVHVNAITTWRSKLAAPPRSPIGDRE